MQNLNNPLMVWWIICHDFRYWTVYYYRYTQSLRAIGENDKTNEMLKKFHQLSGDDTEEIFS
jgi:hypothetical protein